MKHKTLSLYVPCLDGGCEDAGRVDLAGYTLISDKRLYDLEAAEQGAIEQARLNGMGSEREAALMAKLEAAEKNNSAWLYANAPGGWIDNLRIENEALRAKIEQMERQKPVATIHINSITGNPSVDFIPGHRYLHHNSSLYALPGAKGE